MQQTLGKPMDKYDGRALERRVADCRCYASSASAAALAGLEILIVHSCTGFLGGWNHYRVRCSPEHFGRREGSAAAAGGPAGFGGHLALHHPLAYAAIEDAACRHHVRPGWAPGTDPREQNRGRSRVLGRELQRYDRDASRFRKAASRAAGVTRTEGKGSDRSAGGSHAHRAG